MTSVGRLVNEGSYSSFTSMCSLRPSWRNDFGITKYVIAPNIFSTGSGVVRIHYETKEALFDSLWSLMIWPRDSS